MAIESKKVVCEYCKGYCRVIADVENDRLLGVRPDPDDERPNPNNGCVRIRAAVEIMYHPDRVNFPLKRAGERGEGKWQVITWEQALDEIAQKLQGLKDMYGPEAIAGVKGTMRTRNFMPRFFNLLGSPNCTTQGKICSGPLGATSTALFGWYSGRITYGGGIPKSILLTGTDPLLSWPRTENMIRDFINKGAKYIVVDPRETNAAKQADFWLQLRPGTDTALFLSIINVLIEEKLYDNEFVNKWVYGFDQLAARVKEYTPEKVADITWVPAEKIRAAARILGENRPHYSWNGMGTEQLTDSIHALQARFSIAALTGSIDVEGGVYIGRPGKIRGIPEVSAIDALSPEQKAKQLGADRFKFQSWPGYDLMKTHTIRVWDRVPPSEQTLAASCHQPTLYRAMITGDPYPVRGLITMAHNPMITQANTKLVYKALKNLDLHVVMEYWLTPSAELADYVLPAASVWERPFLNFNYGGNQAVPESIAGEYDHRIDYDVFREIGIRLGQAMDWPWKSLEEVYDYQLEPVGMSFKDFMAKGGYYREPHEFKLYTKKGFATATGKAEVYSKALEQLGYDPLPEYEEPLETPVSRPELAKEYPYILITGGRFLPLFHSEFRQVNSLRKRHPNPLVQINPVTAESLGIADGDWVWIETTRGRIRQKCQHFKGIDPRVVHVEHGWWFPELPGEEPWLHGAWESNANVLTDDNPDICGKIHGGWPLRTALCKVYRVK